MNAAQLGGKAVDVDRGVVIVVAEVVVVIDIVVEGLVH